MFTLRNTGKCVLYSKCGCVPGISTEKMFERFFVVHSSGTETTWDYLKSKLGLKKKDKKTSAAEQLDKRFFEPDVVELPVHRNSTDEMWRPGYRGRTESKRY